MKMPHRHKYFRWLDKKRREGKNMYQITEEFDKQFSELNIIISRAVQYEYLVSRHL